MALSLPGIMSLCLTSVGVGVWDGEKNKESLNTKAVINKPAMAAATA